MLASANPLFVDWNLIPQTAEFQSLVDLICDEVLPKCRRDARAKLCSLAATVLANLSAVATAGYDCLVVQLSKRALDSHSKYKPGGVTYDRVSTALNALADAGVIKVIKGGTRRIPIISQSGERRWEQEATRIIPLRFLDEFRSLDIVKAVRRKDDAQTVVLRQNGERVEYDDDDFVTSVRADLTIINDHISRHPVIYLGNCRVNRAAGGYYRVFNDDFDHGGRFYGHFAQHLPKWERQHLRLDDEAVADLDYEAMHFGLLHAEAGVVPLGGKDPFIIPGWEKYRGQVKKAAYAILNAKQHLNHFPTGIDRGLPAGCKWRTLEEAVLTHVPLIDEYAYSGVGLRLTRKESDILAKVLLKLVKHDVGFIPFHDGVMVPVSKSELTKGIMLNVYEEMTGLTTVVKLKPIEKSSQQPLAA